MENVTLGEGERGIGGLKPHTYKMRHAPYWYCVGRGQSTIGTSPGQAYAAWCCAWRYHCRLTGKSDDLLL